MLKALLLLDCDWCRKLFRHSITAALDTTAWQVHGQYLEHLAFQDGWLILNTMDQQLCPDCTNRYWEAERQRDCVA